MSVSDFEVAGSVCKDWSMANQHRKGRDGPHAKFLLIWARIHIELGTPVILHENTMLFEVDVLEEILGERGCGPYIIHELLVQPPDIGLSCVARPRKLHLLTHKERCVVVSNPMQVYEDMCHILRRHIGFGVADLWIEDDTGELDTEMESFGNKSGERHALYRHRGDWTPLLSKSERENLEAYMQRWKEDRHDEAGDNANVCFQLSQNALVRPSMTSKQGQLPTFRSTSSTRMWVPSKKRWMTGREKLACLGFKVFPTHAAAAGVPVWDSSVVTQPHARAGNTMHVVNIGVAMAAVLLCVQWRTTGELGAGSEVPGTPGKLAGPTRNALKNVPREVKTNRRSQHFEVSWPQYALQARFKWASFDGEWEAALKAALAWHTKAEAHVLRLASGKKAVLLARLREDGLCCKGNKDELIGRLLAAELGPLPGAAPGTPKTPATKTMAMPCEGACGVMDGEDVTSMFCNAPVEEPEADVERTLAAHMLTTSATTTARCELLLDGEDIYIYIYRERERERERPIHTPLPR